MRSLLAAELAWYVTGRFYASGNTTADQVLADYGYFLHLAGIDAPLFSGARGETTAYFTFAAQPFKAKSAANGALDLGIDPVGRFSIFLQRTPSGTFDDPASFARGERIATFRRASLVVGTAVATGSGGAAQKLFSSNVFTAWLEESQPFDFGGEVYDLAEMLGRGVTQFGTAAETPIAPPPSGYDFVVPFTGSAIALGT